MNFKKKILLIIGIFMSMLILVACGGGKSTESGAVRDTLIVGDTADPKSLDPHASNDQPSSRVRVQIYDKLIELDNNAVPQPALAESWDRPDDKTIILHLRKGVKFHNGDEMKASDVKFSLDRMKNSPQVAHIIDAINNIEVIDDYTVKVTTEKPFAPLLNNLAHHTAVILSEKAVTEAGDAFAQHPIGTGPYKFVSWASGDRVTLEAFPEYWRGETPIKNLIFRTIVEETNRTIALETGEIDVAYDILGMDKQKLKNDGKLNVFEEPQVSMTYFGFNMKKAPFDNPKVRQAMALAVDLQSIVDTVFLGGAIPANSIIGPNVFSYRNVTPFTQNIEKAKELLKEAGYENGFKTKIWINDNPIRRDIAVILQDQFKQIGIDLAIETIEWGAFLDGTARGDHDTLLLGWGTVTRDPDYGIAALVSTATQGGAGNRSFYSNPKVDELLEAGKSEFDIPKRAEIYGEIQEIIREELPMIMIAYPTQVVVAKKDVKNLELDMTSAHKLYGVRIEK